MDLLLQLHTSNFETDKEPESPLPDDYDVVFDIQMENTSEFYEEQLQYDPTAVVAEATPKQKKKKRKNKKPKFVIAIMESDHEEEKESPQQVIIEEKKTVSERTSVQKSSSHRESTGRKNTCDIRDIAAKQPTEKMAPIPKKRNLEDERRSLSPSHKKSRRDSYDYRPVLKSDTVPPKKLVGNTKRRENRGMNEANRRWNSFNGRYDNRRRGFQNRTNNGWWRNNYRRQDSRDHYVESRNKTSDRKSDDVYNYRTASATYSDTRNRVYNLSSYRDKKLIDAATSEKNFHRRDSHNDNQDYHRQNSYNSVVTTAAATSTTSYDSYYKSHNNIDNTKTTNSDRFISNEPYEFNKSLAENYFNAALQANPITPDISQESHRDMVARAAVLAHTQREETTTTYTAEEYNAWYYQQQQQNYYQQEEYQQPMADTTTDMESAQLAAKNLFLAQTVPNVMLPAFNDSGVSAQTQALPVIVYNTLKIYSKLLNEPDYLSKRETKLTNGITNVFEALPCIIEKAVGSDYSYIASGDKTEMSKIYSKAFEAIVLASLMKNYTYEDKKEKNSNGEPSIVSSVFNWACTMLDLKVKLSDYDSIKVPTEDGHRSIPHLIVNERY